MIVMVHSKFVRFWCKSLLMDSFGVNWTKIIRHVFTRQTPQLKRKLDNFWQSITLSSTLLLTNRTVNADILFADCVMETMMFSLMTFARLCHHTVSLDRFKLNAFILAIWSATRTGPLLCFQSSLTLMFLIRIFVKSNALDLFMS